MWPWALASLGVHATVLAGLLLVWPAGGPEPSSPAEGVEVELLPAAVTSSPRPLTASPPQSAPQPPTHVARVSKPPEAKPDSLPERANTTLAMNNNLETKKIRNSSLEDNIKVEDKIGRHPVAGTRQATGQGNAQARSEAAAQADAARNKVVRQRLEQFKYYPTSARRRGIEGAVDVSFRLDAQGRAENMQLVASSGYEILDEAALETVRRAEPFPVHGGVYRFRLHFRRS